MSARALGFRCWRRIRCSSAFATDAAPRRWWTRHMADGQVERDIRRRTLGQRSAPHRCGLGCACRLHAMQTPALAAPLCCAEYGGRPARITLYRPAIACDRTDGFVEHRIVSLVHRRLRTAVPGARALSSSGMPARHIRRCASGTESHCFAVGRGAGPAGLSSLDEIARRGLCPSVAGLAAHPSCSIWCVW